MLIDEKYQPGATFTRMEEKEKAKIQKLLNQFPEPFCRYDVKGNFTDPRLSKVYQVYLVQLGGDCKILKIDEEGDLEAYETFLYGKELPVPKLLAHKKMGEVTYLIMEYVDLPDLQKMGLQEAKAIGKALGQVTAAYWNCQDEKICHSGYHKGRFWQKLENRRGLLQNMSLICKAFDVYIEREQKAVCSLNSGDMLPINVLGREDRICLIDWAWAGIVPYHQDISRLTAFMGDDYKISKGGEELLLHTYYDQICRCPGAPINYEAFLLDVKMGWLGQYVDMLAWYLKEDAKPDEDYRRMYEKAESIATQILLSQEKRGTK